MRTALPRKEARVAVRLLHESLDAAAAVVLERAVEGDTVVRRCRERVTFFWQSAIRKNNHRDGIGRGLVVAACVWERERGGSRGTYWTC